MVLDAIILKCKYGFVDYICCVVEQWTALDSTSDVLVLLSVEVPSGGTHMEPIPMSLR